MSGAHEPVRGMVLKEAAPIVAENARKFGDVWRVLAITKLAAADIKRPSFQDAIRTLAMHPRAVYILRKLLAKNPHAELLQRERIVYEFLLGPNTFLKLIVEGIPDCPHTYPTADATNEYGVATSTVTLWVQKPTADLAANLDPQRWDNPCGALFFNATYLTDLKSDGTFDVDANYDATPGTPETVGDTWGPRYLFEHFLMPSVGGNFFKNILSVETERRSDGYSVKYYTLESSLRSHIAPDPARDGGLFTDEGYASATEASSPWTILQGSKTVRFDTFPSHTADELANQAATMLQMMGNGFAYWACCPQ